MPKKKGDFSILCLHRWPMSFWDGVVEFLTDEIALPSSDADCETAVRTRVMVFKVGDQSGAVADT